MPAAPLFSVLLPTHDGQDTLGVAMRSVLAQTQSSLELLVVGDGCTDDSRRIAESVGDARARFFDLPKGPGFGYENRNTVLEQARGTYVAFMAHDDLWLPDHLALLHAALLRPGITLAYSRPLWVIPKGRCAPLTFNLHDPETLTAFLSLQDNKLPASCFVYARDCLRRHGGWNAALPSQADWELWTRLIKGEGASALAYVESPTCLHFRARWRREHDAGPNVLQIWQRLHELHLLPEALQIPVPQDELEQTAAWSAIEREPEAWPRRLREAVTVASDRRITQLDTLTGAIDARDPVALLQGLSHFARLREQAEGGLAWRLVQALHALKERAVPPASLRDRAWQRLRRK